VEFEVRDLACDSRGNLFATLDTEPRELEVLRPVVWWNGLSPQASPPAEFIGTEGHRNAVSIDAHAAGDEVQIAISYEDGLEFLRVARSEEGVVRVLSDEFDSAIKEAAVRFLDNGRHLAICSNEGIQVLRLPARETVLSQKPLAMFGGDELNTPLTFYTHGILSVSHDGQYVACTPTHGITQVWRLGENAPRLQFAHQGTFSLTPHGTHFAFSWHSGDVKFYAIPPLKN
jgi:hypothetical protein